MADIDYDGFDPGYDEAERPRRGPGLVAVVNWLGGASSLLLIGGLGYWGYELMMRDVTGVPVVRALEGPFRTAPEDPGGTLAEHQGLAVNEVAGNGTAGTLPDQVLLAPDAMALLDEDLPVAQLPVPVPEPEPAEESALASNVIVDDLPDGALATDIAVAEALAGAGADPTAQALALADALTEGVAPLSDLSQVETVEMDVAASAAEREAAEAAVLDEANPAVPPDAGGVAISPRPQLRPANFKPRVVPVAEVRVASAAPGVGPEAVEALSSAGAAAAELDVASIAPGTRLVQLGAFDSADTARAQWEKISAQFADYFEGKRRVVQRAEAGGNTFWRLRAEGFADLSDARRFCTALLAGSADCIPVVVK